MQAVHVAEKVARYRHAQLSAVRLAGDINATVTDNASLDERLVVKDRTGNGRSSGRLSTSTRSARHKAPRSIAGDGEREPRPGQRKALECRNSFTPACKPPWTGSPSDIPLV